MFEMSMIEFKHAIQNIVNNMHVLTFEYGKC